MLRLTTFKHNFLVFWRIMVKTGVDIDLAYKGRMYRVSVEDLGVDVPKKNKHKPRKSLVNNIQYEKCQTCNGLAINGVCVGSC